MAKDYGINDIQSLDFREGVRTRVQMYLGSDDLDGTYQAFKEIINNSTDEAIAGFGNKIEINVNEEENSIKIRDYGRGVPFGTREDGENVLVSIYTKSHTTKLRKIMQKDKKRLYTIYTRKRRSNKKNSILHDCCNSYTCHHITTNNNTI